MESSAKLPSRYRIDLKIGEGGFGEVFKAYDAHLRRTLAIKILPMHVASGQDTLAKEFATLARLQHPNLVRVFDYGTIQPNTPYFTMEFIEGENLRDYLRKKRNLSNVHLVIKQALNALIYLNRKQILHGDIKPENIIIQIEQSGICTKFLDFGLVSNLGDRGDHVSGTVRYLAPEILVKGASKSPATDLYAFGISLVESILCREMPCADKVDQAFIDAIRDELSHKLGDSGTRSPSALSSFIIDLCQIDPADRIQDAKAAGRTFELIVAEHSPQREIKTNAVFIGRKRELKQIENILTTSAPYKKVVILSGPQGIGKKSILWKASQAAQLESFALVDLTQPSSYFSLNQIADALDSHLSAEDGKRLFARLPVSTPRKLGARGNDHDPDKASVIYARIIEFLVEMSASRRILISITDIERSGDDFLLFVVQLIKTIEHSNPSIFMLITENGKLANRNKAAEAWSSISQSPVSETIEVQPFDDEMLKQYLSALFGQTLLPAKERKDIILKTQGLPLQIAIVIERLLSAKVIQDEEGYWIIDRRLYDQVQIPYSIDDSLALALREISKDQLIILRLLAIHGQAMQPRQIERISESCVKEPLNQISLLIDRAILARRIDGTIAFAHPLYSKIIIDNIPESILRIYCGHIGDNLAFDEPRDSLRLARLYISAGRIDKALSYGYEAINKMYSSYMLFDCLKLLLDLKKAVLDSGNDAQLLSVLEKLAPVERRTGLPKEAIEDHNILANASKSDSERAVQYMQIAQIYHDLLGNLQEANIMFHKALRSAEKSANDELMAAIYQGLGHLSHEEGIQFFEKAATLSKNIDANLYLTSLANLAYRYQLAGKAQKASLLQRTILKNIERADHTAKKEIYSHLHSIAFFTANYKQARFYITKKIQIERRMENPIEMVFSITSLAGCYYTEGSFYRMIDTLKEAHTIAMKYNNYLIAVTILANLSLGYRTIAEYGQSMKVLLRAYDLIKREHVEKLNAAFLNKPTMFYLVMGRAREPEFESSAQSLHNEATRNANRIGLGHHSMAFAIYHMNKLEPEDALLHAKKALAFFKQAADRDDVVSALTHIAIIQLSLGKLKPARTNLAQAEEIYEAIHCEYLKPLLMLAKSMLARLEHSDDARKIIADALRVSKKMGTRETTWQIQREFALFCKEKGEPHKALAHFKDAIETIKQITETIDEEELRLSYLQVPFRNRVFSEIKSLGSVPR